MNKTTLTWSEFEKGLSGTNPECFIKSLRDDGTLKDRLPEIDALFGVPQPPNHHPEVDTGVHTLMVVKRASELSESTLARFAALVHDLGKGTTLPIHWPKHHDHEDRGCDLVAALCDRLGAPKEYKELGILTSKYHTHVHRAFELKPSTLLKTLNELKAFKFPHRFVCFLIACQADSQGRLGFEDRPYPQADLFRTAHKSAQAITVKEVLDKGHRGAELIKILNYLRLNAIKNAINEK